MKHVLIVDDDNYTCEIVTRVLQKEGMNCTSVHDGQSALDLLEQEKFNLLLLDIVMPGLDGWEVIRKVRSSPKTALLPVIFLTGRQGDDNRIQGFKLGADDYLEKPFHNEELRLRVSRMLERTNYLKASKPTKMEEGFQGHLNDIGLGPLLTLLAMENKTGILHLGYMTHEVTLYVRQGSILRATKEGQPKQASSNIIYEALSWPAGTFHFRDDDVTGDDHIGQNTGQLLLEYAQALDEGKL